MSLKKPDLEAQVACLITQVLVLSLEMSLIP